MASVPVNFPYLNRFQPLAYLLVLITITAVCYAEPNLPVFVLGTTATLLSWWLVEGPHGKSAPRWLINMGVLGASAVLFYEVVLAPEGRDVRQANLLVALGHFMGGILLCKLFEEKSNRDYAQILTLTLLIMVAGAILATASLLFAVLLAIYLALGLYTVLLFHLRSETMHAVAHDHANVENAFTGENRVRIRKDIRFVSGWSGILLLVTAIVVFLLFPRTSSRGSTWGGIQSTGYTPSVQMKEDIYLHQSDSPVMEVRLEQNGINPGSETYAPYFRGAVLDTYNSDSKTWEASPGPSEEIALEPGTIAKLAPADQYSATVAVKQAYTFRTNTPSTLFAMSPPVEFASDDLTHIRLRRQNYGLETSGRVGRPVSYTVISALLYKSTLFVERPFVTPGDLGSTEPRRRGRYGFPTTGEARQNVVPKEITELTRDLVANLLPPAGEELTPERVRPIADRIQTFLRSNYPYSLRSRRVDWTLDPTADFLLNRKSIGGHCEFFASAMVMMCRSVGINARMATGYHGGEYIGEYTAMGGFYLVRDRDAHAWVEVYVPAQGWMTYDPSPGNGGTAASMAITRWLHEMSELVQKAWLSTVVAFDNTSRKYVLGVVSGFFEWASGALKQWVGGFVAAMNELLFGRNSPWALKILGFGILAGFAGTVVWLVKKWQRDRTSQLPQILKAVDKKAQRQLAHELGFVDDLLRMLGRRGRKRRAEETPREYVEGLVGILGDAADDARWLIRAFYDIRFGTVRVNLAMREKIGNSLQRVRQELQR